MAMSHVQPLLLLFMSFFFSLAFCDKLFTNCNIAAYQYPIKVSSVKTSPEPYWRRNYENITITGFTSKGISNGVTVNFRLASYDMLRPVSTKSYSLCDITTCPVTTPIVLTFFKFFTPKEKKAATGYTVLISIINKAEKENMMCIVFRVKLRGYGFSLVPIDR